MEVAEICTEDVTKNREGFIRWARPTAEVAIREYGNRGLRDKDVAAAAGDWSAATLWHLAR